MNEAQLRGRRTRIENILKQKNHLTTYEKQAIRKKSGYYIDVRKRID